jgi:secreted trypsin-like serine protease
MIKIAARRARGLGGPAVWGVSLAMAGVLAGSVSAAPRAGGATAPRDGRSTAPLRADSGRVGIGRPVPASRHPRRARASIIGGQPANLGEFPWLAFIEIEPQPGTLELCTGTVVAAAVVLTAGHCGLDSATHALFPAPDYAVLTGAADIGDTVHRQLSGVSQVLVDPLYEPNSGVYDATLLVLSRPTTAPAITLATAADAALLEPGRRALVAGWGRTEGTDPLSIPSTLRWTLTYIQSAAYCTANFSPLDPGAQFCSIEPETFARGTCHGDSGGPLIVLKEPGEALVELGVISRGDANCATTVPNVYTRVDKISPWIAETLTALSMPPSAPPAAPAPSGPVRPSQPVAAPGSKVVHGTGSAAFVARVRHGRALLRLTCRGPATCSGVAKLVVGRATTGRRAGHGGPRRTTLGASRFALAGGEAEVLAIALGRRGRKLLRVAPQGRLLVSLLGTGVLHRKISLRSR